MTRTLRLTLMLGLIIGVATLTDQLAADIYHCPVLTGGAESVTNPRSAMNIGQVAIGRASNASTILHAGNLACLRVFTTCLLGDVNGDGKVDGLDIGPYTVVKITGVGTPRQLCAAAPDIAAFTNLLLN